MATVKHAYYRDAEGNQAWVAYVDGTATQTVADGLLESFIENDVASASAIVIDQDVTVVGVTASGIPSAFWPFLFNHMSDYMITAIYIRGIFLGATP